jgi:predicted extracellular nuclease
VERFKVATFNLLNLASPNTPYYSNRGYSDEDYQRKLDWIASQLKAMDADVVGFQEIFQKEALLEALERSGLGYKHVYVSDRVGRGPVCGLASRFPITAKQSISEFPDCIPAVLGAGHTHYQRPVLRCMVKLGDIEVLFFVLHLKSKRPDIPDGYDDDVRGEALGKALSLATRSAESAALRMQLVGDMMDNKQPVIVLGDFNDSLSSVTTNIISGSIPQRRHDRTERKEIWDTLLYSTSDIERQRGYRDVYDTHIHDSHYDSLDHIFVSEEFYHHNPGSIGVVEYMRVFNDHLVDRLAWKVGQERSSSDHAQLLVSIRLRQR